uniref:Dephospho-CoA kinase domain-containing protein n=1 Tax=Ciona intestinalis TaxID=7719 RepID=H2XR58_CIOIN
MFLVGLTGGIASGKSTVSKYLVELGCSVVDADLVAREVMLPGETAFRRTVETFGREVVDGNGEINREALGEIIFRDAEARKKLNKITHPQIIKKMLLKILMSFLKGDRFVVLDVPLLVESKIWVRFVRHLVVVNCSPGAQLERLMKRNDYTEEEARIRITSQTPLSEKCKLATRIINNDGSIENTRCQVREFVEDLKKSWSFNFYEVCGLSYIVGFTSCLTRVFIATNKAFAY